MNIPSLILLASLASCASVNIGTGKGPSLPEGLPSGSASHGESSAKEVDGGLFSGVGPESQSVELNIGERTLSDDWKPLNEHDSFSFSYCRSAPGVLGWEVGFASSKDNDDPPPQASVKTRELFGGVRYEFSPLGVLRPYLGAGLSYSEGELSVTGFSTKEGSAGLYAHGGVLVDVSEEFYVGLDLRTLTMTDADFSAVDLDLDHSQVGFVIGFSF
ncbi:MAG TPA: outer membrane beta-barrel protein [Planctomycetota bacterium]|jgi:hypothetical protein|nr:hypothetical protein [Planctomycetaceae bacterium]HJM58706.1 outer membrane beta-barrel protein [Planctomycetota bacterium]